MLRRATSSGRPCASTRGLIDTCRACSKRLLRGNLVSGILARVSERRVHVSPHHVDRRRLPETRRSRAITARVELEPFHPGRCAFVPDEPFATREGDLRVLEAMLHHYVHLRPPWLAGFEPDVSLRCNVTT